MTGGKVFLYIVVFSAIAGAMTSFVTSAGGIFGLVNYAISFGWTYGYETWTRYMPSTLDISDPHTTASKAANAGSTAVGDKFNSKEYVLEFMKGKCSDSACKKQR